MRRARVHHSARSRSSEEAGGGGENEEEDCSRRKRPTTSSSRSWMLLAVGLLLLQLQPAAASAQLGAEIVVPTAAAAAAAAAELLDAAVPQQFDDQGGEVAADSEKNETTVSMTIKSHHRGGYDLDYHNRWKTVLRRSEKTMDEYKDFIEKTCRDAESMETYLTWERQQFADHFKASFSTSDGHEKDSVRALIQPEFDPATRLNNICKPPENPPSWNVEEKTDNDRLEDQIVNHVFASMYRQLPKKIEGVWAPVTIPRLSGKRPTSKRRPDILNSTEDPADSSAEVQRL